MNNFTAPKRPLSPFYSHNIKIPRKLKKKVKNFCGIHYDGLDNGVRLWYYLEKSNIKYRNFIIKQICLQYE